MSLAQPTPLRRADPRAVLLGVLDTLPDVHAVGSVPDQPVAGAAWPRWVETRYDGHLCSVSAHTYDVLVVVPAGYMAAAVDEGDRLRDLIGPALAAVSEVQYAEPVRVEFGDRQTMPAVRFRVRID